MKRNIQLIQSGITLVDQAWGGFYKGGTYLLLGPRKSGRTLLGLQYALQAAKQKEICLYFTTMRPKDLMIHAASIDFDLQSFMNQNLIVVVRVAPPTEINDIRNPDEYLIEYFKDIVTVVNQFTPNRIIFDEITPYLGFSNLELLRNAFLQTLETIEEKDIISLFIIGEPATPVAQSIVDSLAQFVTGTIYLQKKPLGSEGKYQGGRLTITPNIGHTEGQFSADYFIEPYKGIVVDFKQNNYQQNSFQQGMQFPTQNFPAPQPPSYSKKDSRYLSLSSFEIPSEPYSFSNLYDFNDFLLILNNQIALYKSTGQVFNIVSFKLDAGAEQNGLLTVNQLQNAIRLATDKKDKICVKDNKVVVLIVRGDKKGVQDMISKIQNNLPNTNPDYVKAVLNYISVLSVEIDENIENAESLMNYITSDEMISRGNFDSFNKFSRF
ncbi:MAG: RAD55 family ATPase [Ignavibacteriales bacterium]|nr:RAD55 family ATPase [Ignavibacteriales bacterium]